MSCKKDLGRCIGCSDHIRVSWMFGTAKMKMHSASVRRALGEYEALVGLLIGWLVG
jgi:hypothetical protein